MRVQRGLLQEAEAPRRGVPQGGDAREPEGDRRLLHGSPMDLRSGRSVLQGARVLPRVLPLHVPREEVLAPLHELHQHPDAAGEGRQTEHVQVRRPRRLRLSTHPKQHGSSLLPQERQRDAAPSAAPRSRRWRRRHRHQRHQGRDALERSAAECGPNDARRRRRDARHVTHRDAGRNLPRKRHLTVFDSFFLNNLFRSRLMYCSCE